MSVATVVLLYIAGYFLLARWIWGYVTIPKPFAASNQITIPFTPRIGNQYTVLLTTITDFQRTVVADPYEERMEPASDISVLVQGDGADPPFRQLATLVVPERGSGSSATFDLSRGVRYQIIVEYHPAGGMPRDAIETVSLRPAYGTHVGTANLGFILVPASLVVFWIGYVCYSNSGWNASVR